MVRLLILKRILKILIIFVVLGAFCLGCAPSYPRDKLISALKEICKKEYNIDVQAELVGKTIIVFVPLDELFDRQLDILPNAIEKIERVILSTSRVILSTDTKIDFYKIIAADTKTTAAEVILVRFMDDVYKFMYGWIKREDYSQRILWQINFNPVLLNNQDYDFSGEEVFLADFLAQQISRRLDVIFASSLVYKTKVAAKYDDLQRQFNFSVIVARNDNFKNVQVPIILKKANEVLQSYKFDNFERIFISNELLKNSYIILKKELKNYDSVNIDELLTLPIYN
ncbi:MAG: hypothetical protein ABIG64_05525 [Candidatus Omnitrophota bacterium]